jgi:hypothetical protein
VRTLLSLLAVVLMLSPALVGQSTFGTILGTVTDRSGSVVPGARITITNTAQNVSRETLSNGEGNYEALNLVAGPYAVSASAQGFKTFRQSGLQLDARQTLRVDVALEVGQLSEQVTVESTAAVINTETQTIAAAFDTRQVLSLPVNYRGAGSTSPYRMLAFLPGVQSDNSNNFSLQGGIPNQVEFSVDGISTVSVRSNGPLTELFPSAEGIAEMKVQAVGNNAEFGQVGDVTTTSRGGGNHFHGSLFEYMQNRVFDAKAFGSVTKPQKTANTYGGSIGGPIFRNRTFFFGAYERMSFRRGVTIQNTVPTALMRQGDFSGETVALRDPLNNNQPFAGNRIPANRLSSIAAGILGFYPLPNFPSPGATRQTSANFRENRANPTTSWQYDIRLDHVISSKQSVFARWSAKNQSTISPNNFSLPADDLYNDGRAMVISHNYTLSASRLNEFRIGLTKNDSARAYAFDGRSFIEALGFQGLGPFPYNGLTGITFSGATTNFGKSKPPFTYNYTFQANDNLTWTRGRHTMKFGFDIRRLRAQADVNFFGEDDYGRFQFDGRYSNSDFGDFLLGLPYLSRLAKTGFDTDGLSYHWSLYGQDSFRVNRKLTLELGLRWEYHPPFRDAAFNITQFDRSVPITGRVIIPSDPQATRIAAPGFLAGINACPSTTVTIPGVPCTPFLTAEQAGYPETLRFADKRNFNPRFGFAWRPFSDNKTVVRGGFGVYTMTVLGRIFYALTAVHGSDIRDFNNSITGGVPQFQWPRTSTAGSGVSTPAPGNSYFGTSVQPTFKDPYSMQWSLTVERELQANLGLRVSYIGMRSVQVVWAPDLNQPQPSTRPYNDRPLTERPFPYWGRIYAYDSGANALYNALQTEVTRRMRNDLTFSSSWTWAKNLSDAGGNGSGFSTENGGGRVANSLNRRNDRGNVGPTRRHRWITSAIYELPFGKGKRYMSGAPRALDLAAGGWRISGILLAQGGAWLTPQMSTGDPSGTNAPVRGTQRPDLVSDPHVSNPTADLWWNRNAFVCPGREPGSALAFNCAVTPIGRFGNSGANILEGPGTVNLSMGFAKDFRLNERFTLTFDSTFTNLPNHPNLNDPGVNINSIAFGVTTSARGADAGGNRVGQFALRLEF